jgi:hypothetical protein
MFTVRLTLRDYLSERDGLVPAESWLSRTANALSEAARRLPSRSYTALAASLAWPKALRIIVAHTHSGFGLTSEGFEAPNQASRHVREPRKAILPMSTPL